MTPTCLPSHQSHDTAYSAIATWYSQQLSTSHMHQALLPEMLAIISTFPVQAQRRILDITCGEGIFTRHLAQAFPHHTALVGIDLSTGLLRQARQQEHSAPQGIEYIHDDARLLATQKDASAHIVTSCLGLTYIDDLDALYHAVYRILCPGGSFVFGVPHPCAPCSSVHGGLTRAPYSYYGEGAWRSGNPASVRHYVWNWHRPLSSYLSLARAAGFEIETVSEPRPTSEALDLFPEYADVPYALIVCVRKGDQC